MTDKRVIVGISGGIDSFMATRLLQEQGYQVIGVHLELWGSTRAEKLEQIACQLNIKIVRYDAREQFKQEIVEQFIEGYLSGQTPNPCSLCNNNIKWKLLLRVADEMGIYYVATGHYVQIEQLGENFFIRKGVDPNKDQSYFLWGVTRDVLARSLTPLGRYYKQQIKEMAAERGFVEMAKQAESMGICFLQGKDYRTFIHEYRDKEVENQPGNIRTKNGTLIGKHDGILNYTVGQKRGIPLQDGQPMYVARIDRLQNELIVDRKPGLEQKLLTIHQTHFIDQTLLNASNLELKVRGLGLNPVGYIRRLMFETDKITIELDNPAWAIASGQPVAIYKEDILLGGGVIV